MYKEKDINDLTAQVRKRTALWLIPEALLLAGVAVSLKYRIEWLTSLLFALLCALVLFSLTLSILPVVHYKAFLRSALRGRTSRSVAVFQSMEREPVVREGVRFYPLTMRVDSAKEELDERQFYWDANLPRPDWREGDKIALRSHERQIVQWEIAGSNEPLEG